MTNQLPQPNELAALIGPVWSAEGACSHLGIGSDVLASRQGDGEVLGLVTSDGDTVYPVFQFWRLDGRVEVRPDLIPVFQTLQGFDGWAVAALLHTPAPELEGTTPLQWLRAGRDGRVLDTLAGVVAREWSSGATGTG